ncbi:MAG: DUF58 domain-containing protein [Nitrososphaerota archaeon]
MLSKEGVLLLISLTTWTILLSSLLYQPFLFLVSIFLQIYYSVYILLASKRLKTLYTTDIKIERTLEPFSKDGKNFVRTKLQLWVDKGGPLHVKVIDNLPYGTELAEGLNKAEGVISPKQGLTLSYVLSVDNSIGYIKFAKVDVQVHDALKLCFLTKRIEDRSEVAIPIGEQLIASSHSRFRTFWPRPPFGLGYRGLVGHDDEFVGVKPYEEGDRLRDVHWLRYARQVDEGEIIAKKYSKKGEVAIHIVVDCSSAINVGPAGELLVDIAQFIRRLCLAAEEEGNMIYFWLLNPALLLEEKISPRGVHSRTIIEQYIARIFPTHGGDSGEIAEIFEQRVRQASMAVFIFNPPSENMWIIERMIDACKKVGAGYVLCLPDMYSYVSGRGGEVEMLLRLDKMLKEKWLSGHSDGGWIIELRKGYTSDIARETVRRGIV